jgi:hypothetical protein
MHQGKGFGLRMQEDQKELVMVIDGTQVDDDAYRNFKMAMDKFSLEVKAAVSKAAPNLSRKSLEEISAAARDAASNNFLLNGNFMSFYAKHAVSHERGPHLAKGRVIGTEAIKETARLRNERLNRAIADYIKNNSQMALLGGAEGITEFIMSKHLNCNYARTTVHKHVKREYAAFRKENKAKK